MRAAANGGIDRERIPRPRKLFPCTANSIRRTLRLSGRDRSVVQICCVNNAWICLPLRMRESAGSLWEDLTTPGTVRPTGARSNFLFRDGDPFAHRRRLWAIIEIETSDSSVLQALISVNSSRGRPAIYVFANIVPSDIWDLQWSSMVFDRQDDHDLRLK